MDISITFANEDTLNCTIDASNVLQGENFYLPVLPNTKKILKQLDTGNIECVININGKTYEECVLTNIGPDNFTFLLG